MANNRRTIQKISTRILLATAMSALGTVGVAQCIVQTSTSCTTVKRFLFGLIELEPEVTCTQTTTVTCN